MNQVWNENEKRFIRENANSMKDKELAQKLSQSTGRKVTIQAVRKQRQKMGITKARGRGICSVVQKGKDQHSSNSADIAQAVPTAQPNSSELDF